MLNPQQRVIHRIMAILLQNGFNEEDAREAMLQWIAYKIGVDPGMISPSIPHEAWPLMEAVDLSPLKEDPKDHIGEYIAGNYPLLASGYLPHDDAQKKAERLSQAVEPEYERVLDPCCGTGSLMIAMAKHLGPKTVFYASEPNLTFYRVALINAKLYDIPHRIINADYRLYSIDEDSPNWRFAGQWKPPLPRNYMKKPTLAGN